MKTMDRTDLFHKYQNKWVALTDNDKVICSGKSLESVLSISKKKGINDPVTAKIPDLKYELML